MACAARRKLGSAGDTIMPFEVKACTIDEMHVHPTFRDRTQARVKVVLREMRAHEAFDHNLTLRVQADTNEQMTERELQLAILTRAAGILKRTMSVADLDVASDGTVTRRRVAV